VSGTPIQGWVLVSCGWLAFMASAMLSPVLPSMTAYFRSAPSVDLQTSLPARLRGSGTGLWMGASFLGQFLSPLVVLGLRGLTGSLSKAILVSAIACGFSGIAVLARMRSPPAVICVA
jgi:hypothetical protein